MANCWIARGSFPMKDALLSREPLDTNDEGISVWRAAEIPGIDAESIIYFAMSVFWRAGAHAWSNGKRIVSIDLGHHLEPLRLFLRDEEPFPPDMELIVRLNSLDTFWPGFAMPDSFPQPDGFLVHAFKMLGLTFMLRIGVETGFNTAPSPERIIGVAPMTEIEDFVESIDSYKRALARGMSANRLKKSE
jgi:hypothetical protein